MTMSKASNDFCNAFDDIIHPMLGCRLCGKEFAKGAPTVVTEIGKVHAHCNVDEDKWRKYLAGKGKTV